MVGNHGFWGATNSKGLISSPVVHGTPREPVEKRANLHALGEVTTSPFSTRQARKLLQSHGSRQPGSLYRAVGRLPIKLIRSIADFYARPSNPWRETRRAATRSALSAPRYFADLRFINYGTRALRHRTPSPPAGKALFEFDEEETDLAGVVTQAISRFFATEQVFAATTWRTPGKVLGFCVCAARRMDYGWTEEHSLEPYRTPRAAWRAILLGMTVASKDAIPPAILAGWGIWRP